MVMTPLILECSTTRKRTASYDTSQILRNWPCDAFLSYFSPERIFTKIAICFFINIIIIVVVIIVITYNILSHTIIFVTTTDILVILRVPYYRIKVIKISDPNRCTGININKSNWSDSHRKSSVIRGHIATMETELKT